MYLKSAAQNAFVS